MSCGEVDELAGAIALDALYRSEIAAVADHLATCAGASRRASFAAWPLPTAMASALEPMALDPALRARVMVAACPPRAAGNRGVVRATHSRSGTSSLVRLVVPGSLAWTGRSPPLSGCSWWVSGTCPSRGRSPPGTRRSSAVAEAISGGAPAYPVSGPAGTGYVIDTEGPGSTFLVAGLESLPSDELYEMWLLDADGTPLAVGTIEGSNADLVVATLEQDLAGFALFAVTVEPERVEAPSSDPVMAGPITN